ncbi:MAG: ribosome small subunit-dependent GTPase A [Bacteroidetes bacterium]|uniref:Small ribosomal subunit biogenesis GTPase RsgA n=1 Tax=Phaeocystidibacter marisrubri TaxID=1577780 RepID=A0A6L3ZEP4_9FLAO|nr:ribosome small subunit-dependent GTPase A [Phaeocystidibacter marisrubri]KAB2816096.1 ribosome small subunit-dependent GTPase A [Phaeocystidibacter marisrubri]TNE26250.1 MAG: ribosome small subunit-dependent GTPase A [Bacteroidota bacterium]GGH67306.1 putative ribosome biogenesis GTPase RsgA [Phaeocystidibacter marisrubri]
MTGTVVRSTGSWYVVRFEDGSTMDCRIKGKFRIQGIRSTNPVAVGDVVEVEPEEERGVITEIHDRRNYIVRRSVNLSKKTHILAANLDQAILVVTVAQPKTLYGFIDRFLATCEAYDVPAVMVFNKVDIYDEDQMAELDYMEAAYGRAGYETLETSAIEGFNIDAFEELLKGKTSLIAGHSGVGKSTLINRVEPDLDLRTNRISDAHGQGQHTTTFAEMFPLSIGGDIIDTPGIRGFGLIDMEKEEIGDYFPEIFELKGECKFHNCLHLEEPGCAVKEALDNGKLAPTRYQSYFWMVTGNEDDNPYRQDNYA